MASWSNIGGTGGGGGGGGAPTDAQYIVNSAHAGLSAERVVTDTSTISKDAGTAGQLKLNVVDASITAAKLATDAVETAKIKDANVTAAKLATDAVETAKIKDANVTTGKIADDAVTPAKTSFYVGTYTAVADRDFDLTSLPSDTFTGYNIYIRGSASASGTFDILLNDTDTCDSTHYLVASGTAVSADENFGPGIISATADNAIHIRIWTKTGLRRKCQVQSSGYYTGQARMYFISGEWTDTSTTITQLTLRVGVSDTWTAGTIAEVWGF